MTPREVPRMDYKPIEEPLGDIGRLLLLPFQIGAILTSVDV